MTGERPDRDAADGRGWLRDLRDLADQPASPLTEATRLHDLAARRDPGGRRDGDAPTSRDGPITTRETPDAGDASASPLVDAIRRATSLDGLTLAGQPTDHRYGRVVGVRATADGRTYDLDLRLFRCPDDDAFRDAIADQFERWRAVSDLDGVVPVVDAAGDPRPWTCTAPVGDSLAERDLGSLSTRLRHARSLTRTLAAVHDRGVVHAGLDPAHVVFAAGTETPQLDNVGLTDVYRRYADPATVLDPRYAPPEYFDDRYGVADRTTDVYGLGALLYRLLTGDAPFKGAPEAVREAVLTESVPAPSAVADVPDAVDDIVARATATDKFDRYDSAAALHADVRDLCHWLLDE